MAEETREDTPLSFWQLLDAPLSPLEKVRTDALPKGVCPDDLFKKPHDIQSVCDDFCNHEGFFIDVVDLNNSNEEIMNKDKPAVVIGWRTSF